MVGVSAVEYAVSAISTQKIASFQRQCRSPHELNDQHSRKISRPAESLQLSWLVRCHGFPPAREWRSKSFGQKLHGDAVDAIAQAGRRRSVVEDVAQMAAAAAA